MTPNKKHFLLIICLLLTAKILYAQSDDWEWIKTFGGKNADEVYSSCLDKSGNIYIAGYFQGEIVIDGKHPKSKGDTDALIAKFDKFGALCWANQAGGDYSENLIVTEYVKKITIDKSGNIVAAGIFAWNATFGNTSLQGAGNNDIFIAKYSPDGELLWTKSFGSFGHDYLFDMDLDESENIYFTGILNGSITPDEENNREGEIPQGSNTFIAKLESSGSLAWLRRYQGAANSTLLSIDKNNYIYYGINYDSEITIDGIKIEPQGKSDFLIQRINTEGETIWQKKYSSDFNDVLCSLKVSQDNMLLISGKYANISEFELKSSTEPKEDSRTKFSCLNSDGSLTWSVNNFGPSYPKGTCLVESPDENIYSSDVFTDKIDVAGQALIPRDNWFNSYLAVYDRYGRLKSIPIQLTGIITSVISEKEKSVIVTGTCSNSIGISQHFNLTGGFIDFFVGKRKFLETSISLQSDMNKEPLADYLIFPNPTENKICTLDSKVVKNVNRINITDQQGKLVQYNENCDLPFLLELFYLPKGTYFVSILKGDKITTKQITLN
jgi:hypothetical protein